jgi:hypothetical protein
VSILTLPEPAGWNRSWRTVAWMSAGTVAFVAWFVYVAVRSAFRGHYLTTVGVGAVVAFPLVLVAVMVFVAGGFTSLRAGYDATGTKLRADATFEWTGYLGFVAFIIGGTVLAIFLPRGMIDLSATRGWRLAASILLVPAVVFALRALFTAYKRGGAGYVKLTPAGLDIANIFFTEIVEWDDIVKVADHSEQKKNTRKAIVLGLKDGSERVIDGLDFYVPRGTALYWMIQHYWSHPDDRGELVDGRALQRLEQGRFEVHQAGG